MMDGILIINKPKGWTSFDVVAKLRNKLRVKKIGHTGTLDPMATGVLVLCLGKATKLVQGMTGLDKEYIAQVTLGAVTNTDDAEGEVIPQEGVSPVSRVVVEAVLEKFRGTFEQIPPQFSAKQIGGKRAYALARKGKEVDLRPVQVTVNELEILDYQWPLLCLRVASGKGFYVRALARDIGRELGVGGYLSGLERTRVGTFTLKEALEIDQVEEGKIR